MRMPALILTVMAATLLMAPAIPQEGVKSSRKELIEESAKKVKELQKERIATLKKMADQITNRYRIGTTSFEEVCETRLLVLKAELDTTEKESDRITLSKSIVGVLKEYEEAADQMEKTGQRPASFFLKVKVRRLEAEIDLERAKAKEAK